MVKALPLLAGLMAILSLVGCYSENASATPSWSGSKLVGKWKDKADDNYQSEVEFYEDGKGILRMREPTGDVRGETARTTFWFTWTLKGDELTVEYSGAEKDGLRLTLPPFQKSKIKWRDDGGVYIDIWDPEDGFHHTE